MADGDQTIVLTSNSVEAGVHISPIERNGDVWELVITTTFDADDTTAVKMSIPLNGILRHVTVALPLTTTTGTTSQVQIKDNGNNVVFDTDEIAENDTHNFVTDIALSGEIDITYEPSAASGDAVTVSTITLRGI
jgi:hypothetical protein